MGRIKAQAKSEIKGIEHPQMAQMAQMKRQEARGKRQKAKGIKHPQMAQMAQMKRQKAKAKPLDRGLHLATMMTQTTTTDKRQHLWIAAYSTPQ